MKFFRKLRLAAGAPALLLALAVASSGIARADAILDFQLGGAAGGTVSWKGGNSALVGASIPIRLISGSGTPLNDGASLAVTKGFLNFTTGSHISTDPAGNLAFAGLGTFTITGSIKALGLVNATLLTGKFLGANFDPVLGKQSLFLGSGTDVKNPALVSYFFGAGTPTWAFSGSIFTGSVVSQLKKSGTFSSKATSVDIVNAAVPEPASILLMGTLLVGVGLLKRRQRAQSFSLAA